MQSSGAGTAALSSVTISLLAPETKKRLKRRALSIQLLQRLRRRWRQLGPPLRHKILFCVSSVIGTALFAAMFESLFKRLPRRNYAFSLSYSIAYILSILWQHALNRVLVFRAGSASFCEGLLQTYAVYSISLLLSTGFGAVLVAYFQFSTRLVTYASLAASSLLNYFLLKVFVIDGKSARPKKTVIV